MELSEQQDLAVKHTENPVIVSSGAGAGKTRVLTQKFIYLVNELNFNPNNILCITFTNKAANELKERICELTNLDISYFPWIRTIHSACLNMLKPFLNLIEFDRNYTIFTSSERKKLLKKITKKYKIKDTKLFWEIFINVFSV